MTAEKLATLLLGLPMNSASAIDLIASALASEREAGRAEERERCAAIAAEHENFVVSENYKYNPTAAVRDAVKFMLAAIRNPST